MKSLFMNPEYADFNFVLDGRDFPIHTPILAARSPVFAKIFKECGEQKVSMLENIKGDAFEDFLFYIYTDHIRNYEKNCNDLLILAHRFGIPSLMEIYKNKAAAGISKTNAVELFQVAHQVGIEDLKKLAFDFISKWV